MLVNSAPATNMMISAAHLAICPFPMFAILPLRGSIVESLNVRQ
jgi:hypothetical protein